MRTEEYALRMRREIIRMLAAAGSGHPGGSLSATDIMAVLFNEELRIDPKTPRDPDRDRFVLSKGHAAPALYAALALKGYLPVEQLTDLRKLGSPLQGHPDANKLPGVDVSTGSLGQGLSQACGMAIAGKLDNKDYRVYAVCGDGEQQEGQIWEAAMLAAHYKLDNLTAFVDHNHLQIDGDIEKVLSPEPLADKWLARHRDRRPRPGRHPRRHRRGQDRKRPAHHDRGRNGQRQRSQLHGKPGLLARLRAQRGTGRPGPARIRGGLSDERKDQNGHPRGLR